MPKTVHLLIIDPQVDFCDPDGSLYVKGAEDDMRRLTDMVKRLPKAFDRIHVTLDSHHLFDVAHPLYWRGTDGKHPDPFTIVSVDDVKSGKWTTARPGLLNRSMMYVETLAKGGRYPLCIWPPHCLIGSKGHCVWPDLMTALMEWEETNRYPINFVTKGSNLHTEHYSAVKAEVPDPNDPSTQINTPLINLLEEASTVAIAGEAGSHCLANTVRDIADGFQDTQAVSKLVLLEDATSPVPNFESMQDDFIRDMTKKGMQTTKTTEFLS